MQTRHKLQPRSPRVCQTTQDSGAGFAFKILSENRDLLVSAPSEAARRVWVDKIGSAIAALKRRTMLGRMRNSVGASYVCHAAQCAGCVVS